MRLIVRWLLLAAALLFVAYVYPGVAVVSFGSAMIAALVLGLLNTLVRPILVILTLPVTLITLGLFLFVINAAMFWAAANVLDGFASPMHAPLYFGRTEARFGIVAFIALAGYEAHRLRQLEAAHPIAD